MRISLVCLFFFSLFLSQGAFCQEQPPSSSSFTNPILPSGPDPWVIHKEGYYYYMNTMRDRLVIWRTRDLTQLETAEKKVVWKAVPNSDYSHDIWAPELHFIKGKWYIYFAADDGKNETHRTYVIENSNADPFWGEWIFRGKVADPSDKWSIDASVFQFKNKWYMIWSGWEGDVNGQQNIYIAQMKNPWTIKGKRTKISAPEYDWERHGALPGQTPDHVYVNEGPEILQHKGEVFLIYSANGCWTDHYSLGMLKLINKKKPLKAASWNKWSEPVFEGSPEDGVYSPGHNSFFKSPDGSQDWILYHANSHAGDGCGGGRSPRMQPFSWKEDGTPNFGVPISTEKSLSLPAGTTVK